MEVGVLELNRNPDNYFAQIEQAAFNPASKAAILEWLKGQLKVMNRQFHFYVKQKTAMKNNLIGLIDQTYPNANTCLLYTSRCV